MDALKAEMERKRKEREDAKAAGGGGGPRKWVKRGELEKERAVKYYETEAAEQEERARKAVAPQHRMAAAVAADEAEKIAAGTSAIDPSTVGKTSTDYASSSAAAAPVEEEVALRPVEVMRRLRALGQPIMLFGETDEERRDRYRAVSSAMPSEAEVNMERLQKGQTWGQSERQLFDEAGNAKHDTAREIAEEKEDEAELDATFVAKTPEETISRHFKQLMKLWEHELESREPAEAASQQGRTATAAFQQCKRHMKPFYKMLKAREMPLDVLGTMVEITTFMQQREYVKAHDAYIKCAIGNAPWPMGITGTGIHERQGRQHLREDKVAHVMNDETQRKYLQSVKRLMSFAQRALPPDGPSKMVLNGSMI